MEMGVWMMILMMTRIGENPTSCGKRKDLDVE
jgi:hypothetical protein